MPTLPVDAPMGGMKDSGIGRRHGEHWLHPARYARIMTAGLRALRHLPGIK